MNEVLANSLDESIACLSGEATDNKKIIATYKDRSNGREYPVLIGENGYQHPDLGFFVVIKSLSNEVLRESVSVWDLILNNKEDREILFQKLFKRSFSGATKTDKEKGVKTNSLLISRLKILPDPDFN